MGYKDITCKHIKKRKLITKLTKKITWKEKLL